MSDTFRTTVRMEEDGSLVIPPKILESLGLQDGSELLLTVEGDQAILMTRQTAVRHAQQLVAKYIPPGVSLSQELIADRREEERRESNE